MKDKPHLNGVLEWGRVGGAGRDQGREAAPDS